MMDRWKKSTKWDRFRLMSSPPFLPSRLSMHADYGWRFSRDFFQLFLFRELNTIFLGFQGLLALLTKTEQWHIHPENVLVLTWCCQLGYQWVILHWFGYLLHSSHAVYPLNVKETVLTWGLSAKDAAGEHLTHISHVDFRSIHKLCHMLCKNF